MIGTILLAFSLSVDALGIGVSYGMRKIKMPWLAKLVIFVLSICFTGISVCLGVQLTRWLPEGVAQYIGMFILIAMGVYVIKQACQPGDDTKQAGKEEAPVTILDIFIKTLGISITIIKDPKSGDLNKSNAIEPFEAFYLGIALSIDSIGAGIAGAAMGLTIFLLPFFVSVSQIIFLSLGYLIGFKFTSLQKNKQKIWQMVPGILLIILAVVRVL